jgi:hypothetical protein
MGAIETMCSYVHGKRLLEESMIELLKRLSTKDLTMRGAP